VRTLLARGADPNVRDEGDNAYPIHFAAERGELAIVELLVEHGADPMGAGTDHLLDAVGWTVCFDYATHVDVARYLLAAAAERDRPTSSRFSPTWACRRTSATSGTRARCTTRAAATPCAGRRFSSSGRRNRSARGKIRRDPHRLGASPRDDRDRGAARRSRGRVIAAAPARPVEPD
jgi:hypothetical protein